MICSRCGSTEFYKNGHKPDGRQRWQCKVCGREQVEKPSSDLNSGETYFYSGLSRTREGGCGSPLTSGLDGETQEREMACLETARTDLLEDFPTDLRGKILEFLVKRESDGYKDAQNIFNTLKALQGHGADLRDPESVKKVLSKLPRTESTKHTYAVNYNIFLKFLGGTWERPKYNKSEKVPFIPTEAEIDQLIAGFTQKISTFSQVLKETGARYGEITELRWIDIDSERKTITINHPEKNGKARILNVSDKALNMIRRLPKKGDKIFPSKAAIKTSFYYQRKILAAKLDNPRLLRISLHTFRHWVGTMYYHKVHSLLHVQQKLGHRSAQSTTRYISIEEALFQEASDDFYSAVAKTVEETCKLVETGFEYVCDFDGIKVFRKRK